MTFAASVLILCFVGQATTLGGALVDGPQYVYWLDDGRTLLVRLPLAPVSIESSVLLVGMTLAAGGLGACLIIAVRLRRRQRLQVFVRTLDSIGRGHVSDRLPVSAADDELDRISGLVNDAIERLGRLMEMLQEQSDHIRHEYGNSAGRMGVYLASIRDLDERLPPAAREAIDALDRERRHFIHLTDAIFNLWQARQGGQEMREQDLAILAGEVFDVLEGRAEETGVRLIDDLKPAPVLGDAKMLMLMITNLLDNALKYTPPGGVTRLRCGATAGRVRLMIDDSGPGIAPDKRQQVFDPRVRLSETASVGGKGYGLAVVKAITEMHLGRIEIRESDLGGACFDIEFPPIADMESRLAS